mgnify:CR=1 FL=1
MDSSDWKAKFADNKNFDQKAPYNLKKILENLDKVTDLDHFNPYYLLSPIYDFTKVFGRISSGLAMGFKDITEKVEIMRQVFKLYPTMDNIQDLIKEEMKIGVFKFNGNTSGTRFHNDPKYKDYVSAARTFLRLLWFMEYLIHIFRYLATADDKSLKDILRDSYDEVLAPRHPLVVRGAVKVALTFASCDKVEAVGYMFEVKDLGAESKKKISMVADKLEKIWKAGYAFYDRYGLTKLE